MIKLGQAVRFIDNQQRLRDALVTHVHNDECVNLVVVSSDKNREDQYGRQTEHFTSVPIKTEKQIAFCFLVE